METQPLYVLFVGEMAKAIYQPKANLVHAFKNSKMLNTATFLGFGKKFQPLKAFAAKKVFRKLTNMESFT